MQRQHYESDPNERKFPKILLAKALIMKVDLEVLNEDYEAAMDTLKQIETIKLHQQIYKNLTEEKQRLTEVKKTIRGIITMQ